MSEQEIKEIRKRSESSGESSDSAYKSDGSDSPEYSEPLMKLMASTTKDIIWDVRSGDPIQREYDI